MRAGQDPATFGQFTPREMEIVIEAAMLRDQDIAWRTGMMNRVSFHAPDDFPDAPMRESKQAKRPDGNNEADVAYARAWMMAMAGRTEHGS